MQQNEHRLPQQRRRTCGHACRKHFGTPRVHLLEECYSSVTDTRGAFNSAVDSGCTLLYLRMVFMHVTGLRLIYTHDMPPTPQPMTNQHHHCHEAGRPREDASPCSTRTATAPAARSSRRGLCGGSCRGARA